MQVLETTDGDETAEPEPFMLLVEPDPVTQVHNAYLGSRRVVGDSY